MAGIQSSINQAVGIASVLGTQTADYKRKQELKGLEAEKKSIQAGGKALAKAGMSGSELMDKQRDLMAQNIEKRITLGGLSQDSLQRYQQIRGGREGQAAQLSKATEERDAYLRAMTEAQEMLELASEERQKKRSIFEQQFMKNFEQAKDEEAKR